MRGDCDAESRGLLMTASDRLLPSLDLVQRVLSADAAYTISRMQVLERLPGNPIGIAYRWMDETVVALAARFLPSFTRVIGLRSGHERHVEPLVRWYREQGLVPTFEMVPGMFDASLGRELARLGFFQSAHHACLIADSDLASSAESQIDVERVQTAEAMERYLDAYVAGWGIAEKDHAQFKTNVRPWLEQAGWSLYLARVDGQPAAAATLYLHDRVGYLADATTDPSFRRRGLQLALLQRRIRDANATGIDFVFSGAEPFSTSHRNMERIGMRVQFIRTKWTAV
jgi:ribosomal protein S18 acetylase RimI-like enzyme